MSNPQCTFGFSKDLHGEPLRYGEKIITDALHKAVDIKNKWFFDDSKYNDPAVIHFINIEEEIQKNITQGLSNAIQSIPQEDRPCHLRFMVKDGIGNIISERMLYLKKDEITK
jgi:hypothetical protein